MTMTRTIKQLKTGDNDFDDEHTNNNDGYYEDEDTMTITTSAMEIRMTTKVRRWR